jgi:hypothetical protein
MLFMEPNFMLVFLKVGLKGVQNSLHLKLYNLD